MIELERHIEVLLLDNDCVIIPDFGGFMTHHVDAHYEAEDQMYYPPLRTIGFNPQLTINDSLLIQSYIDVYDLSYPEALRRIENEIQEVKQHLANKGSFEMSDIGTIYLNNEGNYEFTPCEAGILTPALYGLSSVEMPILDLSSIHTSNTQPATADNERRTVALFGAEQENEQSPIPKRHTGSIVQTPEASDTVQVRVALLRNIAAACLVVLAFLLFPATLQNNGTNADLFPSIDTSILNRIMPKDITTDMGKAEKTTLMKANADKSLSVASTSMPSNLNAQQPATVYHIVLASKVSKKNAAAYVARLHTDGYSEAQVLIGTKMTRVVYGAYDTESKAYQALRKLRQNPEFSEAWVIDMPTGHKQS